MIKRLIFKMVLLEFLTGSIVLLQSCCKCCDDGYYSGGKASYEYKIQLIDTLDFFKQVAYSNSSVVQQSNTNALEWKIFLRPPQTAVYVETKKGWDTLVYEVKQSKPKYSTGDCGESVAVIVSDPVIVWHTFDSAFITRSNAPKNSYSNDYIVTTSLKLKN